MLWTGMAETGLDTEKLRDAFLEWKEVSESFDLEAHLRDAVGVMKGRLNDVENGKGDVRGVLKKWDWMLGSVMSWLGRTLRAQFLPILGEQQQVVFDERAREVL